MGRLFSFVGDLEFKNENVLLGGWVFQEINQPLLREKTVRGMSLSILREHLKIKFTRIYFLNLC